MMAVQVAATPTLSIGAPQTLFEGTFLPGSPGAHNYDVSLDGQQFLMVRGDQEATRPIHVMLNWFDEVIRRVGSR